MKKFTSTQFNQLLNYLYDLQRLGIKVGLEHTKLLLKECGNPQNKFRAIHIAGTNGKGSTAAMLASIFRTAGYRVGLYTSPHLIRFNERVRVNGVPISDEKIVEFVSKYRPAIQRIKSTFFEATTALAFSYFMEENIDIAIVETGLGGRLDSTNVLNPEVSVITSITADHTEILGSDMKQIAFEKGGIIKDNTPLVMAEQTAEVSKVLYEIAGKRNAKIIECHNDNVQDIHISENGTQFIWRGNDYQSKLIGEHQVQNAVLAIETARIFTDNIDDNSIKNGIKTTMWPGRLQLLSDKRPIYYDVAHNPNGIEILIKTLEHLFKGKPIGILALKADKELEKITPHLYKRFDQLIATSIPDADLMPAKELHNALLKYGISTELEENINAAVDLMIKLIDKDKPGIIFGSHYIGRAVYEKFGFSFDKGVI